MTPHALRPGKLAVVATAFLVFPGSGLAVSQSPPKAVVGAGTIDVPQLVVHRAPSAGAPVIARLSEFRPQDYRPRYVLAIGTKMATEVKPAKDFRGTAKAAVKNPARKVAWYRITVPGRPNGRTGWVRASQLSIRPMPWQVVVFRGSRVIQLWKDKKLIYTNRVAVGAPGMETPLGLFYVTVRFKPVKEPFLGAFAFETSGYSKLSDWPGGGVVGLHGWNDPSVIGKAVSHGCIRVSNTTAAFLRDRIPVGTPIRVVAA
jgi:lipoprotein-anchoring transpeptidase ErfK/SrfK